MYLLDTNICIYFIKNKYPDLTKKLFSFSPSDLVISAVTVYELSYGAAKSRWSEKTRQKLVMFLAPFKIVSFSDEDAVVAGELRAWLERQGAPIGPYDLQIATQGVSGDFTIVTHNTKEFGRIPNLKIEDWVVENYS